jgi:hypothetical protein
MKVPVYKHRFAWLLLSLIIIVPLISSCELTDDQVGVNPTIAKLEGEWTCDEESEIYKATKEVYTVYISRDADNYNGMIIDGFYQLGDIGLKATISGSTINIPSQIMEGGFTVSGSGVVSFNMEEINWTYNVDDGSGVIDHVTAVYTRN